MRRRRLLLGAGALAWLGLAGGLVVWLTHPQPGVTRANFYRLRVGMTEQEAEAILGRPETVDGESYRCCNKGWKEGDLFILLEFLDGHLRRGEMEAGDTWQETVPGEGNGLFDRLRRLLGW
jgi:hypothetical protein